MATPTFPEIVSSVDVRVPAADGEGYIAANDNQLLYQYPGALGGKTGFTDDAGNTYVGMAERDGRRLVVTMMNGTQQPRRQWMQGASLLDWGFALPPGTAPVGQLVSSLAEATAAPTPTEHRRAGLTGGAESGGEGAGSVAGAAPMLDGAADGVRALIWLTSLPIGLVLGRPVGVADPLAGVVGHWPPAAGAALPQFRRRRPSRPPRPPPDPPTEAD